MKDGLDRSDPKVKELGQIASKLSPYYHTYLQIKIAGKWVLVDITFNSPLAQFGLKVANQWGGRSDTLLPHNPLRSFIEEKDPAKIKEKMLASEPAEKEEMRKQFFAKLNELIISLRKQT